MRIRNLLLMPFLLLLFLSVGWVVGFLPVIQTRHAASFPAILDLALREWHSPFPVIGVTIGFCAWLLFTVKHLTRDKKLETGREYGEAKFISPRELLPQIAGEPATDKILSQHLHMDLDDRHTGLNASCLLVGGSGSGKSFRYVAPNLLQANSSFVVTDPKGTLLADYGNYLLLSGHQVKVINISDPASSDPFNPFSYIGNNSDIVRIVNDYIRATTPKNSSESDIFWRLSEAKLGTALIQLMFVAFPEDCTMERFLKLVNMLTPPGKQDTPSELDRLFEENREKQIVLKRSSFDREPCTISGQRAYENYMGIMQSADDTCRSVIISLQSRYDSINNSPDLVNLLSGKDSVDLRALGTGYNGYPRKTALFIVSSDIDRTFAGIVLWVQTTLFRELYAAADELPSGRLPIPVQIYLDEFANVPQGENVLQLFATARSRGISITAIVQSYGQLKGLFKDESENIQGSADTFIYMGSNEPSVHKAVSEQLGKYSIHKQGTSDAVGFSGSNSITTDAIGKDLLSPDRVRMLPGNQEIILIRGYDPVMDAKYRTEHCSRFQKAMGYGKYDYAKVHVNADGFLHIPTVIDPEEGMVSGGTPFPAVEPPFQEPVSSPAFFTSEELFSLPDTAFDLLSWEEPSDKELLQAMKTTLAIERVMDQTRQDSLEYRLTNMDFSDEQKAQAIQALQDGISEEEILLWFSPETSPEVMQSLRAQSPGKTTLSGS